MDTKELRGLYEAYTQVYEPEYFFEEVNIATEYFINEGYDETDVKNLIEELGVEEFAELVYEIVESVTLSEAKGKRRSTKTVEEIKAEIDARDKAKAERAAARKAAKSQSTPAPTPSPTPAPTPTPQPAAKKPQGIGGLIGNALTAARQRAKDDTELLKKSLTTAKDSWQSASNTKAAQHVRIGAKKAARAVEKHGPSVGAAAGRALGNAARATLEAGRRAGESETGKNIKKAAAKVVFKDEYDVYNYLVSHLLDEGFAESLDAAENIINCMSDEWIDEILDEGSGR